jgi:putative transposase
MKVEEAKCITQLENENVRLKKLLAEAELEWAMLKDLGVAPVSWTGLRAPRV